MKTTYNPNAKRIRHGLKHTRFYNIFCMMTSRCRGKMAKKDYFDRGIEILWKDILEFKHDMYESYLEHVNLHGEKNTQIDRINNNGSYSKENCRWVTVKENCNNRRSNVIITRDGETKTLKQWAELISPISYKQVWHRINKLGWSTERALTLSKTNKAYTKIYG